MVNKVMPSKLRRVGDGSKDWHFVRSFSIDSIIQIVGIAVVLGLPMLYWGRSLESRVLTIENFNSASAAADLKRDADTREQRTAFSGRMDKIEEKLNNLQVTAAAIAAAVPRQVPIARR